METISTQTGILAAQLAETKRDPDHKVAYANRAATLNKLVAGHNEAADALPAYLKRIEEVEARLKALPFPVVSS